MKTEYANSICPLDCADTCSLSVEVEDGNITAVRGSKVNAFTDGKICAKVAKGMVELVHGDKRLNSPLKRVGERGKAEFEAISWQQAYEEIHMRFKAVIQQHGSESVLPLKYGGPMGMMTVSSMDERFFQRLGASQLDSKPLCAGVSNAAWESVFGNVGGISPAELSHSKLIVIWANNITVGHLHLIKIVRQARKDGAKVVVIDPRHIRIADDADLFLEIKPGTDVVLAYAVANRIKELGGLAHDFIQQQLSGATEFLDAASEWTLERAAKVCGLRAEDIDTFAKFWCEHSPAALSVGVAMERNRNGGSAIRAAFALPLLTGNFLEKGAGICKPSGYFSHLNREAIKRLERPIKNTRTLNILDIGQHIVNDELDTPIKVIFIYNHNPVAVHPRQKLLLEALKKEDIFIVAYDHTLTDSVAHADIVLPACTSMEHADLYKAYGHSHLQYADAVIPPFGESKNNTQVFRELATVFGFDDPEFQQSDAELLEILVSDRPSSTQSLDRYDAEDAKIVFRTVPPATHNNKALLFSESEQQRAKLGTPRFQNLEQKHRFTVISPSSEQRINSTFGGTMANKARALVTINEKDAKELKLTDGQQVKLVNQQAELELTLQVSELIKPGVACVDKGAWLKDSASNLSINALIPGHKADMAEGACYNDCQADIVPLD